MANAFRPAPMCSGAKNENLRGMVKPEINMADENPRVSGTKL